jgi:hypothetical protein
LIERPVFIRWGWTGEGSVLEQEQEAHPKF